MNVKTRVSESAGNNLEISTYLNSSKFTTVSVRTNLVNFVQEKMHTIK
jgi:hypothetical protein